MLCEGCDPDCRQEADEFAMGSNEGDLDGKHKLVLLVVHHSLVDTLVPWILVLGALVELRSAAVCPGSRHAGV